MPLTPAERAAVIACLAVGFAVVAVGVFGLSVFEVGVMLVVAVLAAWPRERAKSG